MIYCEKCGTKLENKDKFCKKCGTKVIKEHPKEKVLEEITLEKENTSEEMNKPKEKNNIDESTIVINSEDVHNELEKTYETMVKEKNKKSFSKENYDEMEDVDFEDDDEDYDNKNKKILVFASIFIVVICFITAFLFKDNIMCNHYIKRQIRKCPKQKKYIIIIKH